MLSLMRHFKNKFWHSRQFSPRPRCDLVLDPDAIRSWHQMRISPDQDVNHSWAHWVFGPGLIAKTKLTISHQLQVTWTSNCNAAPSGGTFCRKDISNTPPSRTQT